jgi:hypothetical protein
MGRAVGRFAPRRSSLLPATYGVARAPCGSSPVSAGAPNMPHTVDRIIAGTGAGIRWGRRGRQIRACRWRGSTYVMADEGESRIQDNWPRCSAKGRCWPGPSGRATPSRGKPHECGHYEPTAKVPTGNQLRRRTPPFRAKTGIHCTCGEVPWGSEGSALGSPGRSLRVSRQVPRGAEGCPRRVCAGEKVCGNRVARHKPLTDNDLWSGRPKASFPRIVSINLSRFHTRLCDEKPPLSAGTRAATVAGFA